MPSGIVTLIIVTGSMLALFVIIITMVTTVHWITSACRSQMEYMVFSEQMEQVKVPL